MRVAQPVAEDFLDLVDRMAGRFELPRVRGMIMPNESKARGKDAEFCALELEDGSLGLTYVWLGDTYQALVRSLPGTKLAGLPARDVANWYQSSDEVRRTLGFAAINALSQSLFRRAGYTPEPAPDSIGALAPGPADHVGMIGLFPPLIEPILSRGARLTVLELNPDLVTDNPRFRVTLDTGELCSCNKVISTSTVLLNDTLDTMLAACGRAGYVALIGPTASCLPDPLFARGVQAVGGTLVTDPAGFRAALHAGEKWGRYARKYFIRREGYPGADALLGNLRG